ncbi:DUF309 domain-containing protein [Cetobacterium sp.]|uniref:DUF309 domain-containing protein n=1 Tax=Cetobacterium sp. TaxID=2071632 RepID=UPI003F417E6F
MKFIEVFEIERDFFECHEILEEIWIEETNCETKTHVAITLLLISVGLLHWKNGNYKGAQTVLKNSLNNYDEISSDILKLKIDVISLKEIIQKTILEIEMQKDYKEIYLPLY